MSHVIFMSYVCAGGRSVNVKLYFFTWPSILMRPSCFQGDPYIIKDEKPKKVKKKKSSDQFKQPESTIQFVDSLDEIDDEEMMVPPKKKKTIRSYNKEQDAEINSSSNVIPDKQVGESVAN